MSASFELGVLNDAKLINEKLIVELKIFEYQDKINVEWKHAYIKLINDEGVAVKIQLYNTYNDTITDVLVNKNSFEFTLHVGKKNTMKITGNKKGDRFFVEGVGLWWSAIFNKWIKIEWYLINERTLQPLREIFLINL